MTACPLDRTATTLDRLSVDLADCDVVEIIVGLFVEFEKPTSVRPEGWPPAARNIADREAARWIEAHPDRAVRLASFHVTSASVCLALHHAPRKAGA
jgi:hypothetical protein